MQEIKGIYKSGRNGGGHLRLPEKSLFSTGRDILVPAQLAAKYALVTGAELTCAHKDGKVAEISAICGLKPGDFAGRRKFPDLVAIDPCEKLILEKSGELSMRIVDLIAPIGKGTRGLIVSPPKSGKTTLLEQIARGVRLADPGLKLVLMLIDERPEEVTHFRRTIDAQVLASSNDHPTEAHAELAELVLANIRTELECGHDVFVLVDSLTRMGRAFNLNASGKGRMMSGGIEAGALELPRKFFGAARNIEDGGSITIIATALLDTGSRMDQFIFEEFKGTGNSEIMLEREMAESRIFPAIDLSASGTRKEAHLHGEDDTRRLDKLRRILAAREPKEAMLSLQKLLDKYPTNREFLDSIPAG